MIIFIFNVYFNCHFKETLASLATGLPLLEWYADLDQNMLTFLDEELPQERAVMDTSVATAAVATSVRHLVAIVGVFSWSVDASSQEIRDIVKGEEATLIISFHSRLQSTVLVLKQTLLNMPLLRECVSTMCGVAESFEQFCDVLDGKDASPDSKLAFSTAQTALGKLEQVAAELEAAKQADASTIGLVSDVLPSFDGMKTLLTRVGEVLVKAECDATEDAWAAVHSNLAKCKSLSDGSVVDEDVRTQLLKDLSAINGKEQDAVFDAHLVQTEMRARRRYSGAILTMFSSGARLLLCDLAGPQFFDFLQLFHGHFDALGDVVKSLIDESLWAQTIASSPDSIAIHANFTSWAEQVITKSTDTLASSIEVAKRNLIEKLPPKELATNKKILSNVVLQKQLFENPHRGTISMELKPLSEMLQAVTDAQAKGLKIPSKLKDAHAAGLEAKTLAKTLVGLDFALDEVLNRPKQGHKEIKAHAETIKSSIRRKKIKLPVFMEKLLDMMEHGKVLRPAAEAPAGPGAVGAAGAVAPAPAGPGAVGAAAAP